jgi:hypothetical protein
MKAQMLMVIKASTTRRLSIATAVVIPQYIAVDITINLLRELGSSAVGVSAGANLPALLTPL